MPLQPTAPGAFCHQRLRAPAANRAVLVEPGWDRIGALLRSNQQLANASEYELHGRPWRDLRRAARAHLLHTAWQWTVGYRQEGYRQGELPPTAERVFLAGHQPELFHPGVWLKNFVLGTLARQHDAVAINLVVDSDVPKRVAIAVPSGPQAEPHVEMVPFDRSDALMAGEQGAAGLVPYEERAVLDEGCFRRFGSEVARRMIPHVVHPFIEEYWPTVLERLTATANLGQCLAQARHLWETRWGARTLEAPLSRVCESEAFRWFAVHLFARLPDFWQAHNTAVADYRRVHRIRHPAQPVPRLVAAGEWLEAPFWLWQRADPVRRPVFVRRSAEGIVLSDLRGNTWRLPFWERGDLTAAVARLTELAAAGLKLRPRALITTLWARLALGDLFIHGIGGAKYDQITDMLIARFFGLPAPAYMVVSGTLHLPVALPEETCADVTRIRQQLWALQHHPEMFFASPDPEAAAMIAAKRQWIATPQTPENARTRRQEIRRLNAALSARLEPLRRELLMAEAAARRNARATAVWTSREYAFCLFPAELLQDFLWGATSQVPANLL